MPKKRFSAEQIVTMLRQIEVSIAERDCCGVLTLHGEVEAQQSPR